MLTNEDAYIMIKLAARSQTTTGFKVYSNNENIVNFNIALINFSGNYPPFARYSNNFGYKSFRPTGNKLDIKIEYTKNSVNSNVYLDCFDLNFWRSLKFDNGQMSFRNYKTVSNGRISEFVLSNANNVTVWNVTDPVNVTKINGNLSGSNFKYKLATDSLLEFISFNGDRFLKAEFDQTIDD